ncbi:MAG: hypothetical protein HN929_12715 [Chloroflexi bacterium]|nr:hypothetical protein [Chloroflexota bacterium]
MGVFIEHERIEMKGITMTPEILKQETVDKLARQTPADRCKMMGQLRADNADYDFNAMSEEDLADYLNFHCYTVIVGEVGPDDNVQCEACDNTIPADARCPYCGVAAEKDERVLAIRADALIGNDSCSFIDECLSAADIVDALDKWNILSPRESVKTFIKAQTDQYERGLNARAGNDDDPELIQYNEWILRRDAHLTKLAS